LTEETVGVIALANNLAEKSPASPVAPIQLTEKAVGTIALANNLAEEAVTSPVAPIDLTEKALNNPVAPIQLTEKAVTSPIAPIELTEQPVSAVPRSLTALVDMHFFSDDYSQNGNPVLFDDLFTYSRNSNTTFINRRIDNLDKFEYFLDTDIVGNVENLALHSEQYNDSDWTKANSTILANNGNDENGEKTADLLHPTTTGTLRGVNQSITATTANHNVSFKVKADGFDWIRLLDAAGVNSAWFNVKVGLIGTRTGSTEAKIEPLGNGYFRCSIGDAGAVSGKADLILADADNSTTATLNGTNGVLLSGSQLTLGLKVLPYVKTITSSASETFTESLRLEFDPITGESLGALLEGGITNLLLRSEEFDNASWNKANTTITANDVEAPDETTSMDKLVEAATTTSHSVNQVVSFVPATYTQSIFVKAAERSVLQIFLGAKHSGSDFANFDLATGTISLRTGLVDARIEDKGNGVFKCSVTFVSSVTDTEAVHFAVSNSTTLGRAASYLGDVTKGLHAWGAQIEKGSIVTSYIRTEGSTVTRADDDLTIPQAGNASSGIISIHCDFNSFGDTGGSQDIYRITGDFGSAVLGRINGGDIVARIDDTGTTTVITGGISEITNKVTNILDILVNDFYVGGVFNATDSSEGFTPDNSASIGIGNSGASSLFFFGHIKKLSIYDEALTAQEVSLL